MRRSILLLALALGACCPVEVHEQATLNVAACERMVELIERGKATPKNPADDVTPEQLSAFLRENLRMWKVLREGTRP